MKIAGKSIWKYRIVYHESFWERKCAERIRTAIFNKTGIALQMVPDIAEPKEFEILVGKTCRKETVDIRASYDKPNVYYDIKVVGAKLVCVGEGFRTLDEIAAMLEKLILASGEAELVGNIVSGDLRNAADGNMIDRAENTDVRVLDWNLNAPSNTGENYLGNAEMAADVILRHLPDVFSANELYDSVIWSGYKRFFDAVANALEPYYTVLKSSYDDGQPPEEELVYDPKRYGTPPEQIFYRRDVLNVIKSGYRYTPSRLTFHGYHWAIFDAADKGRFIFTVGHYEDCRTNPLCAIEHMKLVDFVQQVSGSDSPLPAIITGDLYTHHGCVNGGYNAFSNAGYIDAQREAEVNCNGDIKCSTYHNPGEYQPRWANIDLVLYNDCAKALKFKVITSQEALDITDHCPICADLKFI